MLKIFVTGDNHFGKKYSRYYEVKPELVESRFKSFENMVRTAESEGCGLFVVTGDLFDNINYVATRDVKRAAEILNSFDGTVLVLPGNHDYYTGDEKVWKDFENAIAELDSDIVLLNEYRPYQIEIGEEKINIFPAFCQSKHSKDNNLGWIKELDIKQEGSINIGIAHGAIKGVTPDFREEYFLMTEEELKAISVDLWLIGHTHIPYPNVLSADTYTPGFRIFNPGTHEQTDLHNSTEGSAFILEVEKDGIAATVNAKKAITGQIRFYDLSLNLKPDSEHALADGLTSLLSDKQDKSIVRVKVSGSIKPDEYEEKETVFKNALSRFITYEKEDAELSEEITLDKIRTEYSEISFAAKLLEALLDNPTELQMTYNLLKSCQNN